MKKIITILTITLVSLTISLAFGEGKPKIGFGFNAPFISGFSTGGAVFLTGGGAYDPEHPDNGFLKSGGHFRCLEDINNGPLTGCKAGEGVRWDAVMLLPSFTFKCTGADGLKPVVTSDDTVVMIADFYRQGDGNIESFTAHMFVSEVDQATDLDGIQNIWIQGVGCGEAIANFAH